MVFVDGKVMELQRDKAEGGDYGVCTGGLGLFVPTNWRNYDMLRELRSLCMKECNWDMVCWGILVH